MGRKGSSNWNLEELTNAEVYLAIRHLGPDEHARADCEHRRSMIMINILILVLGLVGLLCFYQWSG
jgi:hypothetical protein